MKKIPSESDWKAFSDTEFLERAEDQIRLALRDEIEFPSAPHDQSDMARREAMRRGAPELYDQAWFRAAGIEAARPALATA